MNNIIFRNIIRFIALVLLQVLIFKQMELSTGIWQYLHVFLYPLIILLLPLRTPPMLVLIIALFTGLTIDVFYDSLGVHASACVFLAFLRPLALGIFEPREGYNVNISPTKKTLGMVWFSRYSAVLLAFFMFFYFSVEAFTFVYLGSILLKTLLSYIATMIFVLIYMTIFDPEQ
jgi:hypothetical protein